MNDDVKTKHSAPRIPYIAATAVLVAIILLLQWNPALWGGGDNAVYMNLGRAIFEGRGFVQLHVHGNPPDYHVAPGFPVILAGIMALTDNVDAVIVFKLFSTLCMALFLVFLSELFARHLKIPPLVSSFIAIYLAISPQIAMLASSVMTEAPFLLLSLFALFCIFRFFDNGRSVDIVAAAIFSAAAVYIRLVGFPLIIAIFFGLLFARKFREGIFYGAISGGLIAPWLIHILRRGEITYVAQSGIEGMGLFDLLRRAFENISVYITVHLPMLFAPWSASTRWLEIAMGIAIFALALAGFILAMRNVKARTVAFLALAFVPEILLFHYCTMRYLVPMAAPVMFLIFLSLNRIAGALKFTKKIRAYSTVVTLLLLFVPMGDIFAGSVIYTAQFRAEFRRLGRPIDSVIASTEESKAFYDALFWVKENTPSDAVLISSELRIAYFISDRPGVYIGSAAGDEIWRKGISYNATHLLLDRSSPIVHGKLLAAASPYADCFSRVFTSDNGLAGVFKIDTERLAALIDDQ